MTEPRNATELYEILRTWWGIGDYDEDKQPYWRFTQSQAGQINRICKRRRITVGEMYQAAVYARENNIPIRNYYDLTSAIPLAKRAARRPRQLDARERLVAAAAEAQQAGHAEWAQRLYGAAPEFAEDLLAQWEAVR